MAASKKKSIFDQNFGLKLFIKKKIFIGENKSSINY